MNSNLNLVKKIFRWLRSDWKFVIFWGRFLDCLDFFDDGFVLVKFSDGVMATCCLDFAYVFLFFNPTFFMGLYSGSLFEFVAVRALVGEELGSESYTLSSGFQFCYPMDCPGTHHLFYYPKPQLCALFLDIIDFKICTRKTRSVVDSNWDWIPWRWIYSVRKLVTVLAEVLLENLSTQRRICDQWPHEGSNGPVKSK